MPQKEDTVKQVLQEILTEIKFSRSITNVAYRKDSLMYMVLLDDKYYCEVREKLVDAYLEFKHEDVKREIAFVLKHAVELDEFEQEEVDSGSKGSGGSGGGLEGKGGKKDEPKGGIVVDTSADYDF